MLAPVLCMYVFKDISIFVYVGVLSVCMSVHLVYAVPVETRRCQIHLILRILP